MRFLLSILLIVSLTANSQFGNKNFFGIRPNAGSRPSSGTFSFTAISSSTDFLRPGAGAESWYEEPWNNVESPQIPAGNSNMLDMYRRFTWRDFETTTQGAYSWTVFDQRMNAAIDAGRKLNFGVMPCDESVYQAPLVGGAYLTYPTYLHNQMQGAPTNERDWIENGFMWVPNWNSEFYLSALEDLLIAINDHLNTTTYSGVLYRNAVNYIDLRGYGNFGEWHTYPWTSETPTGRTATVASLIRIIDAHTDAFPNHPLIALSDGFANWGDASTPNQVVLYLLNASNAWGPVGWRRDNWGNPNYADRLIDNPVSYNGQSAQPLIMARWQTSPIVGEPWNGNADVSENGAECPYYDFQNQVETYHANSFGNGNYQSLSSCMMTNVRNASRVSGYRLALTSGGYTIDATFIINLYWQNLGVAPTYEHWNVMYELRAIGSSSAVWTQESSFDPFRFLPSGSPTLKTDSYSIPALTGTYNLYVRIDDANGYRDPLPLAITGRGGDGAYLLGSVTF